MYHCFRNSVERLAYQRQGRWHIWSPEKYASLLTHSLHDTSSIETENKLKEEKLKQVFTAGANQALVIKWQQYRDPRRLWKANYFRNQRLTRNEGGMLRTEWMNNCFLQEKGINVAKPIAFAEKRVAGVIIDQAMICENLKGALRLKDYIDDLTSLDDKKPWIDRGIQLATLLHRHGCYHLDFHHRNILFVGETPYLIDNEKLIHFDQPREDLLAMMLGRLGFSLRDDQAEHNFYRSYAQPENFKDLYIESFEGKLSGDRLTKVISQQK